MRVFLDANILFLAAKTDGAVRQLLRLLIGSRHELWADEYVTTEARRNLGAKGPEATGSLDVLLTDVHVDRGHVPGASLKEVSWLPEKDRPVLAAAMRLLCDALLTGDRTHFGPGYGRKFGGVVIHSPRSLAELFLGR
jgi:hypothetical protein